MSQPICQNCSHFYPATWITDGYGACKRYPATLLMLEGEDEPQPFRPEMYCSDTCGEFNDKNPPEPVEILEPGHI